MLLPRPWQMMYLSDSKSLVFPRQAKLPCGEHWLEKSSRKMEDASRRCLRKSLS